VPYLHTLDVMQPYYNNPHFLEAKAKNHINLNDFCHIQKEHLKDTIDTLFSKENAPLTLTALDKGYFTVSQLAHSEATVRNSYLEAMFKNEATNFDRFEKNMQIETIESVISQFTRKK
jgi:hypothetical protein